MNNLKIGDTVRTEEGEVGIISWFFKEPMPTHFEFAASKLAYVRIGNKYETWAIKGLTKVEIEERPIANILKDVPIHDPLREEDINIAKHIAFTNAKPKYDFDFYEKLLKAAKEEVENRLSSEPADKEEDIKVDDWIEIENMPTLGKLKVIHAEDASGFLTAESIIDPNSFIKRHYYLNKKICRKIQPPEPEIKIGDEVWVKAKVVYSNPDYVVLEKNTKRFITHKEEVEKISPPEPEIKEGDAMSVLMKGKAILVEGDEVRLEFIDFYGSRKQISFHKSEVKKVV